MKLNQLLEINESEILLQFVNKVRERREDLGMTQKQLAQELNLSSGYISKIEQYKRTPDMIAAAKLMAYLNFSLDDCLSKKQVKTSDNSHEDLLKKKRIHQLNVMLDSKSIENIEHLIGLLKWKES